MDVSKEFDTFFLFSFPLKISKLALPDIMFKIQRVSRHIRRGKRDGTIEFCQVRHVEHKNEVHEHTMTRTWSKALGLFEGIIVLFIRHVCLHT